MTNYRKIVKELLEYSLKMEKQEHDEFGIFYESDREEALIHSGKSEAYHDMVHKIRELIELEEEN